MIESQNPSLSIIIVNWNGKKWLKKCLDSLYEQTYKDFEIIVVDNASSDSSVFYISKNYKKVILIENEVNLGFARGNNIAYEQARGKYIFLLNTDAYIYQKKTLELLIDFISKHKNIGVVQPRITLSDNSGKLDGAGSFLTYTGFLYHFGYLKDRRDSLYNSVLNAYSCKGAALLIRKDVVECAGGLFDDDYFLYFEETDFCHRVWLSGFSVVFTPIGEIRHIGGGSTKTNNRDSYMQYLSYRNRIMTYIKNFGAIEMVKILPLHILLTFLSSFAFLFLGRWKLFFYVNNAILWNIVHLRSILQKRREVQNIIRKQADSEFFYKITKSVPINYFVKLFSGAVKGFDDNTIL